MTSTSDEPLGVIFDVDGVLVDSYTAHFRSWVALADERGCHRMTEDEFRATFGRTSRETIAQLWPGEQLAPELIVELDDRKEELFRDMLRDEFIPIPGAADLITACKESGLLVAAGSSGPPDNVYLVLEQLQRRELFDVVITGVDVSRGKPHPEVFLNCANRLGVPSSRCIVIEDAVVGVQAANSAGCLSVAFVAEGRDVGLFDDARHIVRDLTTLTPPMLRQWLLSR